MVHPPVNVPVAPVPLTLAVGLKAPLVLLPVNVPEKIAWNTVAQTTVVVDRMLEVEVLVTLPWIAVPVLLV